MPGKTDSGQELTIAAVSSFNEAPAKCRGKRGKEAQMLPEALSFNEAPAKCRGKPGSSVRGCRPRRRLQ